MRQTHRLQGGAKMAWKSWTLKGFATIVGIVALMGVAASVSSADIENETKGITYASVSAAVAAASANDVIRVDAGTYYELGPITVTED